MSELRANEREAHELGGFLYWYMIELSRPPMPEKYQVILRDLLTVGVQRWLEYTPYDSWGKDWDALARHVQATGIQEHMTDELGTGLDQWL